MTSLSTLACRIPNLHPRYPPLQPQHLLHPTLLLRLLLLNLVSTSTKFESAQVIEPLAIDPTLVEPLAVETIAAESTAHEACVRYFDVALTRWGNLILDHLEAHKDRMSLMEAKISHLEARLTMRMNKLKNFPL